MTDQPNRIFMCLRARIHFSAETTSRRAGVIRQLAWFALWIGLQGQLAFADPFLEPQPLPEQLGQLTFQSSESGNAINVRFDDDRLPIKQDFFADGVSIPFFIEGRLIDSTSGNRLHAWQVAPKADANGVAILFLHGNSGNILSNLGAGIALVKQGFKVTIVDYSGFGYSTGEATRENVLKDAESTLEVVAAQAGAEGDKLVLYGQSLGGHLAVVVAARHSARLDALVIEGAFSSHKAMAAHRRGGLAKAFVSEPYSALESIGEYMGPILVIHSRDDQIVPLEMGQALYKAANEPKSFMEIEQAHLAGLALYAERIGGEILAIAKSRTPEAIQESDIRD